MFPVRQRMRVAGILLPLVIFLGYAAPATPVPYRLQVHDGLPSNYIYHMLVDRNGYLWMATTQGVVKYNGFEFRTFDLSAGVPGNDIWGVYEDDRGRIWLSCICPSIGYIYNNTFRNVQIKDPPSRLHPLFWKYQNSMLMHSQYNPNMAHNRIYIEQGDTMYGYQSEAIAHAFHDPARNEIFYLRHPRLIRPEDKWHTIYARKISPAGILNRLHYRLDKEFLNNKKTVFFSRYMILHPALSGNYLQVLDITDTAWQFFYLDEDTSVRQDMVINVTRDALFVVSGNYLYRFNDAMQPAGQYRMPEMPAAHMVSAAVYDSLWGTCIGTSGQGLYISHAADDPFMRQSGEFSNYRYMGKSSDGQHFWWDRANTRMALWEESGTIRYHTYRGLSSVLKVIPWTREKSLLLHYANIYMLDNRTGVVTPFMHDKRFPGEGLWPSNTAGYIRNLDIAVVDTSEFFLLSRSGLFHFRLGESMLSVKQIEDSASIHRGEAYTNLTYDSVQQLLWAYNDNAITAYERSGKVRVTIRSNNPGQPGIRNVERIIVDNRYGNVFLKEFDRLLVYNIYTRRYRLLYPHINLEKSLVYLHEDMLITAGRFGIAFSRITGESRFSGNVVYGNIKNRHYNDVLDIQVSAGVVWLNTDKGLLSVPVPDTLAFLSGHRDKGQQSYRFVLGYADGERRVCTGDTVYLDQNNLKLRFDVIRPAGNGRLKYQYCMDEADARWYPLNGNELLLPGLVPGKVARLSVMAADDVWKSSRMDLYLYPMPYWWQTTSAKRIIMGTAVLSFICLVWGIAWTTKQVVVRKNVKRNLHMEMELKSIYAQINPHFIFNTLNSALLLIETRKIEDAHRHVSRFSRLLRAYIKSSRNRFITIADEVENLKNYIELQQIRFKGKFDYEIILDDSMEVRATKIPSLLLQPIVENAINHGLFHKKGRGLLNIAFKKGDAPREIICTIEDNGIGRKQSKQIRKGSSLKQESYGDQLIEDLVRIFNKYERMNIAITYIDKEMPLSGTLVTLSIKRTI